METLQFDSQINAPKERVWNTMLGKDTYQDWAGAAWPGSTFVGSWDQGAEIRFLGPDQGGGTLARIVENKPYESIRAEHIAVVQGDGSLDTESDVAKGWVGSMESYSFSEEGGKTHLHIEIRCNKDWTDMFTEDWPKALEKLKDICEA